MDERGSNPDEIIDKDVVDKVDSDDQMSPPTSDGPNDAPQTSSNTRRRYKSKQSVDQKAGAAGGRRWTKLEDPEAPRKPRSAYVHFLSSRRASYGTVKQGCDQKSINVALAAEWQALGPEQREVYMEIANRERTEYQQAMAAYQKTDSYAEFIQKKEMIMRQRKKCRKMGLESDSFIEKLVLNMSEADSGVPKSPKKGRKGQVTTEMEYVMPTLPDSDIPIFSKEFINYNRERESQLRLLRRAIAVAENEQDAMKTTMDRLQANCETLRSRETEDDRLLQDTASVMDHWSHAATSALQKAQITVPWTTSDSFAEYLAGISSPNGCESRAAQTVRDVLQNVSFQLPK